MAGTARVELAHALRRTPVFEAGALPFSPRSQRWRRVGDSNPTAPQGTLIGLASRAGHRDRIPSEEIGALESRTRPDLSTHTWVPARPPTSGVVLQERNGRRPGTRTLQSWLWRPACTLYAPCRSGAPTGNRTRTPEGRRLSTAAVYLVPAWAQDGGQVQSRTAFYGFSVRRGHHVLPRSMKWSARWESNPHRAFAHGF